MIFYQKLLTLQNGINFFFLVVEMAAIFFRRNDSNLLEKNASNYFILFSKLFHAFDTFGFLAPEAVGLLHRVQKVMHSNVMSPRSMNVVFTRIGFAIQKGLAAHLVVRLPSI